MNSYLVSAVRTGVRTGEVLGAPEVPTLSFGPSVEFRGEEGFWTPQHLFAAAVATCYITSLEATAEVFHLQFQSLEVTAEAIMERDERGYRFTRVHIRPKITVSTIDSKRYALSVIGEVERTCLIANSITSKISVEPLIQVCAGNS